MATEEKPSWRQSLHQRMKRLHWPGVLAWAIATSIFVVVILMMILLPLYLIPASSLQTGPDTDPTVQNNNNWLPSYCPIYTVLANGAGVPLSDGPLRLPMQRPDPDCRTFSSAAVEKLLANITARMVDKDLARLFENTYPNTLGRSISAMLLILDTTVSWYTPDENNPLAYVITGDIAAQWLRDSSHQFVPYLPLIPYDPSLRILFRGLIGLEARHIADKPYCNAFQPPPESGLPLLSTASNVKVQPGTDDTVYQCKWEIDSLASFLRLSWGYWESTGGDKSMITGEWLSAVEQIMNVLQQQSLPTLATDGSINPQAYSYQPVGSRAVQSL